MFCPKCGNQLPDNATFCNQCGNPLAPTKAAASKPFRVGLKAPLTGLILKGIAFTNLLFSFIMAIIMAAKLGSLFRIASYGGSGGVGGFGVFLLIFFAGIVNSAIVYGIGDIIERMGDKKDE